MVSDVLVGYVNAFAKGQSLCSMSSPFIFQILGDTVKIYQVVRAYNLLSPNRLEIDAPSSPDKAIVALWP